MVHASLFSGIGGPEVAAAMLGWENAFHCEINPFGKAVLDYWFPNSKSYEDITKTNFNEWRGRVDVLTGGFPCQPFSYAGKRAGRDDERYLWPEMLRAIGEIRPTWVVGENVAGITTMVEGGVLADMGCDSALFAEGDDVHRYELERTFTIERICRDIERIGYTVQPILIPAAGVGAPHRRDRVFIIAFDANAHGRNDQGNAGENAGEGHGERVQERDEIRVPGIANRIRSEVPRTVANTTGERRDGDGVGHGIQPRTGSLPESGNSYREDDVADTDRDRKDEIHEHIQPEFADGAIPVSDGRSRDVTNAMQSRRKGENESGRCKKRKRMCVRRNFAGYDCEDLHPENRWAKFPTVTPVHRGNDGFPFDVDNLSIPFTRWRIESLKAYGNAIVPQVMYRIFQAIEATTNETK